MKKIALASEGNQGLDSHISQHFGRCPYYLMVYVEGETIIKTESVSNPYYQDHAPGIVPKFIHEQGANVMIAGGIGPMAIDLFASMGIEVVSGVTGGLGDVLQAYLKGEISGVEPCQHDHSEGHDHH